MYAVCITVSPTCFSGAVFYDKLGLLLNEGVASFLGRCGPFHNLLLHACQLLVKLLSKWKILQTTESIQSENLLLNGLKVVSNPKDLNQDISLCVCA